MLSGSGPDCRDPAAAAAGRWDCGIAGGLPVAVERRHLLAFFTTLPRLQSVLPDGGLAAADSDGDTILHKCEPVPSTAGRRRLMRCDLACKRRPGLRLGPGKSPRPANQRDGGEGAALPGPTLSSGSVWV